MRSADHDDDADENAAAEKNGGTNDDDDDDEDLGATTTEAGCIQSLEAEKLQLEQRAMKDTLTGLSNRAAFGDAIDRAIGQAAREATTTGLIFSDIDKFKNLNDTYGHQFGDEVLRRVAQVFERNVRQADMVARYGGEEFVVVAHQPTVKGIEKVAERLRAAVEAEVILHEGERVPVTVSLGSAIAVPARDPAGLAERLVAEADEAMYEAKHAGRNQCRSRNLIDEVQSEMLGRAISRRFSRWLVRREVLDIPTAQKALGEMDTSKAKIGGLAIRRGWLDAAGLDAILTDQTKSNERFCEIAIRLGLLDRERCAELLAVQAENPQSYAVALVTFGILERDRADALLKEYLAEGPAIAADVPLTVA
ncbi:MAG: GGDEF domain-containing protein [Planctomycetota bacterium]